MVEAQWQANHLNINISLFAGFEKHILNFPSHALE
jgi:hypothetical protein